jgi:hypothetical protein
VAYVRITAVQWMITDGTAHYLRITHMRISDLKISWDTWHPIPSPWPEHKERQEKGDLEMEHRTGARRLPFSSTSKCVRARTCDYINLLSIHPLLRLPS